MPKIRYRGKHLLRKPNPLAKPAAAGTATALLFAGPAAAGTKHKVRPGETLSGIAARYGVSVSSLVRGNSIDDPNLIIAGERLSIRSRSAGSAGRTFSRYTVRAGDTLSAIAARYGTTIRRLARINKVQNPNLIVAGQRLRVPGGSRKGGSSLPDPAAEVVAGHLERSAARHGMSESLVKAVGWQESGWQQNVVSSAGAIGVMQVMPGTADYVNEVLGAGDLNVRATRGNVELGVRYLHHLSHQMPTTGKILAAYYTGPGNVGKRLSKIQRTYVRSVKALRSRF